MWFWLVLVVLALVLLVGVLVALLWRGRTQALALRPVSADAPPADDDSARLPAIVRELHPSFRAAVKRLRGLVRSVDFRYGVPWYLLVGPPDAGKTTLLTDIPQATPERLADGGAPPPSSISWHYLEGGVLIDVPGVLAFPRGRGVGGWRALLQLLTRYRPRRPIDGILVAVPAWLLLDEGWKSSTHDLGTAIRERLMLAQDAFGFSLPIYVMITQSDAVPGFAAFADALPDSLQQNMIGWSNPHDLDVVFQGTWIDKAFEELHRGLVHLQVELLATGEPGDGASALFLFPGELRRLGQPLRALLEEIFRPSAYHAGLALRGFYLTGQGRVARDRAVSFFGDLLEHKVFPERGLAAPLGNTSVARTRSSRIAQATAALLLLVLGIGTYVAYRRLENVRQAHADFFAAVDAALDLRLRDASRERTLSDEERIAEGYNLLESVEGLSLQRFASPFLPTYALAPILPRVERVLNATFGEVVLPDFRLGLEHKGQQLFDWTGEPEGFDDLEADQARPALDTSPHYRALEAFASDYRGFVDNYFRYVRLSRTEGGAFEDLAALGNYVTGRAMLAEVAVPLVPYGQAVLEATSGPVDCSTFDGRVEQRARRLLAEFGSVWFGDNNPVRTAESRLVELWTGLTTTAEADLRDLVRELDRLEAAVTTWSRIGSQSGQLRLPVLEQAPFARLESPDLCAAIRPDLSDAIRRTAAMRDGLSGSLLAIDTPPFGPLLARSDDGLQLGPGIQQLKAALDDFRMQAFRLALPTVDGAPVLPAHPTWRTQELDEAVGLFAAFDRYRGDSFADIDPAYRRPLLDAVTADVSQALALRVAFDATESTPPPAGSEAMMADILRLGTVLTRIERLIPFFEDGDVEFAEELTALLNEQAAQALRRLDQDASEQLPYVFGRQVDAIFASWTEVQAESLTPPEAVKRWLGFVDEQREAFRRYTTHAEPLARFLARTPGASPLAARWIAIVDDLMNYERKVPGNGLVALEAFLRDSFTAILADPNCAAPVASVRSVGFFASLRNQLAVDTARYCRDASRAGTERRYAAIAQAFNGSLAGRFPFSEVVAGVPDAAAADVAAFLQVYGRNEGRTLAPRLQVHACSDEAMAFVRRLDSVVGILAPVQDPAAPALSLEVLPEFRVNREREVGGNQIIQWQLDIGRQTLIDTVPAKPVRWTAGDPVRVVMRFAKDSPSRPVIRAGGIPSAAGRTAQFEFGGAWALLALVRASRADAADLPGVDAAVHLLRFEIPVERDPAQPPVAGIGTPASPFRVYLRLRLSHAGKPDPITIGDFPARAPGAALCTAR